ncbi:MAG: protease inhibitor I42 family protein, partial [bacterium]
SYNQPYYGIPSWGYQYGVNSNYAPQAYYDRYGQYYQNPLQKLYKDADEELDDDDDGDDITLEEGETLSIILRSNQSQGALRIGPDVLDKGKWILDTDKLDSDIIKKISDKYFPVPEGSTIEGVNLSIYSFDGREQWIFEAKSPGTTIIELHYKAEDELGRESIQDTFKIEVTVVED